MEDAKWGDDEEEEAEDEDDELPFACYLCRKPWAEISDPVSLTNTWCSAVLVRFEGSRGEETGDKYATI